MRYGVFPYKSKTQYGNNNNEVIQRKDTKSAPYIKTPNTITSRKLPRLNATANTKQNSCDQIATYQKKHNQSDVGKSCIVFTPH